MFLQKISLNEEAQVYNVVLNRMGKEKGGEDGGRGLEDRKI